MVFWRDMGTYEEEEDVDVRVIGGMTTTDMDAG